MSCAMMYAIGTQSWAAAWPFFALWIGLKLVVWAAIVTAIVLGVRWLRRHRCEVSQATPLEILRARYARGELSQREFESMRQDLER